MARIAIVSFRLGGTDGVSIEAAKWIDALKRNGHSVVTVAGEGDVDIVVNGLGINSSMAPDEQVLRDAIKGCDLVIVENLASLPLNVTARDVLYRLLHGRAAIFHHHDLAWQREHLAHLEGPRDEPQWHHVTINELSRHELAERGIAAQTIMNSFDCSPPRGQRETTRTSLGVANERLVLLPTRAIARKNVAGAVQLAERLGAVLWLLGPPEDGYDNALHSLLAHASCRVLRGLPPETSIHDAYAACDLVVMPSTWEGFGNPVLESVTHRRPLALNIYPVAREIMSFGFEFFQLHDVEAISNFLDNPEGALLDRNLERASRSFNVANLPQILAELLAQCGIGETPIELNNDRS